MYAWLWRTLPGPVAARLLQYLVLLAAVVVALFLWVFPWVESQLPYSEVTVPGPESTSAPSGIPSELPAG
ncbi:MAG TPA: hypothetical protein VM097_03405 [Mycobacteriales bacterium]|nr:hypothetical protein [Mycobacteriales bacterium]